MKSQLNLTYSINASLTHSAPNLKYATSTLIFPKNAGVFEKNTFLLNRSEPCDKLMNYLIFSYVCFLDFGKKLKQVKMKGTWKPRG